MNRSAIGKRHGSLVIIGKVRANRYLIRCDCGVEKEITAGRWRDWYTCGHDRIERVKTLGLNNVCKPPLDDEQDDATYIGHRGTVSDSDLAKAFSIALRPGEADLTLRLALQLFCEIEGRDFSRERLAA